MTTTFRKIVRIQQREEIGTDEGLLAEIQIVQNVERTEITVTLIAINGFMCSNVYRGSSGAPEFNELQQYLQGLEDLIVVQLSDWEVCIWNTHITLHRAGLQGNSRMWTHLSQMLSNYFENKLLPTNVFK